MYSYQILDTPREVIFDDLVALAASIAGTKMAAICFQDRDRTWCKAKLGLPWEETPLEKTWCAEVVSSKKMLQVAGPTHHPLIKFYTGFPLIDAHGPVLGAFCVMDGSERELSPTQINDLQALVRQLMGILDLRKQSLDKHKAERLAIFMDAANIGTWEWHIPTGTLVWNSTMFKVHGQHDKKRSSPLEAWTKSIHPEDQAQVRQSFQHAINNQSYFHARFRVITESKEIIYLESKGIAIKGISKSAEYVQGTTWDVTEEVMAKKKLQELIEKAQQNTQRKTEFLSTMSHEIRTPLNAIIGMGHLALTTSLSEEQKEYLDVIKLSADALLAIINDVLDFSKIEAGKIEIEQIPFHLGKLLQDCHKIFSTEARQKKIDFTTDIPESLNASYLGDPNKTQQVLVNLIGNALKFTSHGKISVRVQALAEVPHSKKLPIRFEVQDSGMGVAIENQSHIFSAFDQGDKTTGRRFGGTGLGLSICKKLVTLMGGQIGLESQLGQGSTFWFELAMEKDSSGLAQDKSQAANTSLSENFSSPPNLKRKGQILLAEDNLFNQKMIVRSLERYGYQVTPAENGNIAIQLLEKNSYDLILMDCQMPERDGHQTTEYIRSNFISGPNAGIPIVAMTADALETTRSKCFASGMNQFLTKPIQFPVLVAEMDKFIGWKSSIDPSALQQLVIMDPVEGVQIMKEFVTMFIEQSSLQVQKIIQAFNDQNASEIHHESHKFKSSAGYVGAFELRDLCQKIESLASKANLEPLPPLVLELQAEYVRVQSGISVVVKILEDSSFVKAPGPQPQANPKKANS